MKYGTLALLATLTLIGSPALAEDRNPDLMDRLGRALQNDNRSDRDQYGSSGYDRNRDYGRDDRARDARQRQLDDEQRELDRRRRELDRRDR